MESALSVAVLGVGSLGKEHARVYSELAAAGHLRFAGVYDLDQERAGKVAEKTKSKHFKTLDEAIAGADALSIVTPTSNHYQLAKTALETGKHVLVEKPMTNNTAEAQALINIAQSKSLILQVGHIERFNPIFSYLQTAAAQPRFIESHRLSPYPARSTDVGVVLDLMIHDIDIILAFVKSDVVGVDAVGIPVLSKSEDIANARLKFANGCIANLTASRVSVERVRKIRVFSGGQMPSYISLDYRAQEGFIFRIAREEEKESSILKKLLSARESTIVSEFAGRKIVREPVPIEKQEPLRLELESFVRCCKAKQTPVVTGESARQALDLAFEITRQIHKPSVALP